TSIVNAQTPSRMSGARVTRRIPSIQADTVLIAVPRSASYEKRPRQQRVLQPDHPLCRPLGRGHPAARLDRARVVGDVDIEKKGPAWIHLRGKRLRWPFVGIELPALPAIPLFGHPLTVPERDLHVDRKVPLAKAPHDDAGPVLIAVASAREFLNAVVEDIRAAVDLI